MEKIIFLDTETTDKTPGQICQLSYIIDYGRTEVMGKNWFLEVDSMSPGASAVHGLTVEGLKGRPRFKEIANEVLNDLRGGILVCHNIAFDSKFLTKEFDYIGGWRFDVLAAVKDWFCTMKHFTPICGLFSPFGGYKWPTLGELCRFLDVRDADITKLQTALFGATGAAHDSRYDVSALMQCYYMGVDTGLITPALAG